jgi:hypothetical protein
VRDATFDECTRREQNAKLPAMNPPVPFCEECGVVGVRLSGLHPEEGGVVRWAIYRCGHVKTQILLDEVPADKLVLLPAPSPKHRLASSGT